MNRLTIFYSSSRDIPLTMQMTSMAIDENEGIIVSWYCNAGILIYNSSSLDNMICLCPYGYYGERCEFQRRRVSIILKFETVDKYSDEPIAIKLVFYLIGSDPECIFDYQQLISVPYRKRHNLFHEVYNRYLIQLLYPINSSIHFQTYIKIDAFVMTENSLNFQASWHYDLLFPFIPVQSLSLELFLISPIPSIGSCTHGRVKPFANKLWKTWCQCNSGWKGKNCDELDLICQSNTCSPGSVCIPTKNYPICLCPLYRFGPSCRVIMDLPCRSNPCKNNGTCMPSQSLSELSFCMCTERFRGSFCEKEASTINIQFDHSISEKFPRVPALIVNLNYIRLVTSIIDIKETYIGLFKNVQLGYSFKTIFVENFKLVNFGFIQLLTSPSEPLGQYFLVISNNVHHIESPLSPTIFSVNTSVIPRNRCPNIDELFHLNISRLTSMSRAKFYHEPCQNNSQLVCFHDDSLMCLCNRHRLTQCFPFRHQITKCSERHVCLHGGLCFQESNMRNPLDYFCICEECYFGDMCQFTTSQYSISIDALIGQSIKIDVSLREQPTIIQICFVLAGILFVLGVVINIVTISLFTLRQKCRENGCGFYILTSSIFGICSLTMLFIKFISLIYVIQMFNHRGCILIEYFLKYLPTVVDWMNMYVSLERVWIVRNKANFNKTKSKRLAKIIILTTMFLIALSLIHDPLHRESIVDPRLNYGLRPWCVVRFNGNRARSYNMTINLLHYFIPFLSSLIATVIILTSFARTKAKVKHENFNRVFKEQLVTFKHWIISPIVLVILALPRLIFALIFTCISASTSWQIYMLLVGYFVGFLPQMGSLIIFVLPSKTYKHELITMIKGIRRH
jgi:hypothetical protein